MQTSDVPPSIANLKDALCSSDEEQKPSSKKYFCEDKFVCVNRKAQHTHHNLWPTFHSTVRKIGQKQKLFAVRPVLKNHRLIYFWLIKLLSR